NHINRHSLKKIGHPIELRGVPELIVGSSQA
ncbi:unnamed protein product, partial [Allacma fusca]